MLLRAGFNPLHCGAVVASGKPCTVSGMSRQVSIPFIAGQWSLPTAPSVQEIRNLLVSIPFIAGQWSLRQGGRHLSIVGNVGVSIPFIAGQWSLQWSCLGQGTGFIHRFNPLHCGAVVASYWIYPAALKGFRFQSPSLRGSGRFAFQSPDWKDDAITFQSPSLRGSGRFHYNARRVLQVCWSFNPLHCGAVVASRWPTPFLCKPTLCFNPLHCGAVVASWLFVVVGISTTGSFNPLHCGAVVASSSHCSVIFFRVILVSIPFIAGQWSLPIAWLFIP